jgi:hypothetical protein
VRSVIVALLAVALQTVIGSFVSIRLLSSTWRSPRAAERLLGFSVLLAIALGCAMRVGGAQLGSDALAWLGNACSSGGFFAFVLFVRRVFRPQAMWATAFGAALGDGFLVQSALFSADRAPAATLCQMALAILAFGWGALEATREARRQARSRALGFGDARVHRRLRLLSALSCSAAIGALAHAVASAAGFNGLEEPIVLLVQSASGITVAAAMLLAFAPPKLLEPQLDRFLA